MNVTDPASIDITGILTLTSDVDAGNPADPVAYPVYSGDIKANRLEVNALPPVWPPVPPTTTNSPKAQELSGNLTIGTGGVSVGTGAILSVNGTLTFTGAATITMNNQSHLDGTGTIIAGGDISLDQIGQVTAWRQSTSSWVNNPYNIGINFNMGASNLDIAYAHSDKLGLAGSISGTGKVTIHSTVNGDRAFDMAGSSTYSGGTYIYGTVATNGKATTAVRVYESDEESFTYYRAGSTTIKDQYYYTKSLGSGRITLENACISNGEAQHVTLRNELYVPDGCWGVIRPGSATSGGHVQYFDIEGKITGGGAIYISQDSGTALIRNSNNDYSGGTFIGTSPSNLSGGWPATIEIGADNCLGTGAVTLNNSTAELNLNGHKLSIGGLSSEEYLDKTPGGHSGKYLTDVYIYDGSIEQTATLSVGGGDEYVYAGKFTDKNGTQVLKDMVKTGPGTQTFMSELSTDLQLTVEDGTVKLSVLKDATTGDVLSSGGIYKTPIVKGGAITTDYTLTYADQDYLDINGGDYSIQPGSSMPGTIRVDLGSLTDFSRFDLLEKPTYTEGIGFVNANPVNGFVPESTMRSFFRTMAPLSRNTRPRSLWKTGSSERTGTGGIWPGT